MPELYALDGHDAAGKTTLARRLAAELGGVAVRAFAGAPGAAMIQAAEGGDAEEAWRIGTAAVRAAIDAHRDARVVVFDRCWLTVFSLVPASFHPRWEPRVPTALLWADLAATTARLGRRPDEEAMPDAYHARYLALYRELAERWGCAVVRTDQLDEDQALASLVAWTEAVRAARR